MELIMTYVFIHMCVKANLCSHVLGRYSYYVALVACLN